MLLLAGCNYTTTVYPDGSIYAERVTTPTREVVEATWTPAATMTPAPERARVTTNGLNLNCRAAPALNATIVASLPDGALVDVLGESAGWLQVRYQGVTCWASGQFLVRQ